MSEIPSGVVAARVIDADTGAAQVLKTKVGSHCHFVERFLYGQYEIGLRFDWGDRDANGDPMLDADFYAPGSTKPIKSLRKHPAHHTGKTTGEFEAVYPFAFEDLRLDFVLCLTKELAHTIDAILVKAPQLPE